MQEIILLKDGEIALKGLNRNAFAEVLIANIRRRLGHLGRFDVTRAQSTVNIIPQDASFDIDQAVGLLEKVFGIASFSRACAVKKDIQSILEAAPVYLKETLGHAKTFKVEAKRSDKRFPLTSPEISRRVGGCLDAAFPHLKVDVLDPDVVVMVEIRDFCAYIHAGGIPGAGGLPVGTGGRAALLISGGIDSPVAGYMMAKRGMELCSIHFASPPYTSERAKLKVLELLKIISAYTGRLDCHIVPFTDIQQEVRRNCPEDLFTIIMRRLMMQTASIIAQRENCASLVTGESLGQVASQTMEAIACTDAASSLPVLRPLIGMDKAEIVAVARKIGTFETSTLPYEDCCTVFTPRHPRTRPKLKFVELAQAAFDFDPLVEAAAGEAEKATVG
jgi:thiamine biosynthesis protein ThiI